MSNKKIEGLKDIRNVCIDKTKPINERIQSLYNQMIDPYYFKYKNITVTIEFNGKASIEEIILA